MDATELTERMLDRERAANVRKHWVRLVTACNSRCVFCLDTDTPRNVYLLEPDVRQEIKRGRDEELIYKALKASSNSDEVTMSFAMPRETFCALLSKYLSSN